MAEQTYFEDVKEGQELPPIKITPDKQQLVKFAAGSGDFNPLHFDESFPMLKPMGLTSTIVHGRFKYAQVGRLVCEFAGYKGRIKSFGVSYRGMDMPNKEITVAGVVTGKRQEGGENLVDGDWHFGMPAGQDQMTRTRRTPAPRRGRGTVAGKECDGRRLHGGGHVDWPAVVGDQHAAPVQEGRQLRQ